jgi:polysaccharide deacetylase family protein (PEP-CTERM system associated)
VAAGHEIGTHGYSHESVEAMPAMIFREELHRSVEVLRQQTGQAVLGHRAADFSISGRSLHLLEHLGDEELAYDSSIFPVWHPRYGVPGAWRYPHRILCASGRTLVEFPVATVRVARVVFPAAGGGYLRFFPYWWTRFTLRRLEQEGSLATCYLHPYELDTQEMYEIPYPVPTLLRWSQNTNRRSVRTKLQRLLAAFRFMTMAEAYNELTAKQLAVGLDLSIPPAVYPPQAEGGVLC